MADTPRTTYRADYAPPPFLIDRIDLRIELGRETTQVSSTLTVRRNPAGARQDALVLDGKKLDLVSVMLDANPATFSVGPETLTIANVPDSFTLRIETRIRPQDNTELTGLYRSRDLFCTQCEAEGFRRITYFLDRPDVMSVYTTTVVADRAFAPVLLSNGNLTASGDHGSDGHFATWEDPFPKPSYLFALVAGPLEFLEDRHTTRSGRVIVLRIYVRPGDVARCRHAMDSLKKSMAWDEDVYGLECDLDMFMIVAVDDFNMGAMENKGLNIFNSKLVLANPETATDSDYHNIEAVIAHEYFHNWTGNRVTCRDWFELTLKEGLTVFRDQQFSADMGSAADCRIREVRQLRASQFPEDASPMAHPVRPEAYIEINNFYTATVYQKGAEVVRMQHTLLGQENFRKGMDLYFQRHDGQAVTCDDFVQAMQDASGIDLGHFRRWYSQSGTPALAIEGSHDAASRRYTLTVSQQNAEPLHVPLALGLLDPSGREIPLRLSGEATAHGTSRVLNVHGARDIFVFEDIAEKPIASLLRGFSAPANLTKQRPDSDLAFLMAHDSDPFARWEAGQEFAAKLMLRLVADRKAGRPLVVPDAFIDAMRRTLDDQQLDGAFKTHALALPGLAYLGELMPEVDIDGLWDVHLLIRRSLSGKLKDRWTAAYDANRLNGDYRFTSEDVSRRSLRNTALLYLCADEDPEAQTLAARHFSAATNMTDAMAALAALVDLGGPVSDAALAQFYERWKDQPQVLDKWFSIQAWASSADTLERVRRLLDHPAYDALNPNRVRALVGTFAMANLVRFHDRSGGGYSFLADQVLVTDKTNPQLAAALVRPLGRWRRYDAGRQALMKAELERIVAQPGLSPDVFEIASKSLA